MPRVLTMDLSSHAGVAMDGLSPELPPICFTWELPVHGEDYGEAFSRLRILTFAQASAAKPDIVAFEKPLDPRWNPRTNIATFLFLTGLAAVAEEAAYSAGVRDIRAVPWKTWFSHFNGVTSGGEDPKAPTLARCRQLGWAVRNDNEADACGIFAFVKASTDPKWSYPVGDKPLFRHAT